MAKSDSLEFQTQVNENLKTVIANKDKELELIRENQKSYENIIKLKEEEIESLNKNIKILKTQKFVSYLISAGTLIFSGYILVIN